MKKIVLLLMLTLLPLISVNAVKRALVIGVSEYRDQRWMKPRISAERDVEYVKTILLKSGFQQSNIKILKNSQATKAQIVSAMKNLAVVSQPGDIVFIHFSGHGQLMTDVNGDETADLLDGKKWDGSWIPYDASYQYDNIDHGQLHLCDDEVAVLLTSIKKKVGRGGEILVVVDACYSGDSTKGNDNESEEMDKFYDTVGDTLSYEVGYPVNRGASDRFVIPNAKEGKAKKASEQWITISACESYQMCGEMLDATQKRIGLLTYGLYNNLSKLSTISNDALQANLVKFISDNRNPKAKTGQRPIITGMTKNNISRVFK